MVQSKLRDRFLLIKPELILSCSFSASKAGSELRSHYSVGWHWFKAGDVTFNGETKNVVQHMIDMFDSTDMHTAYIMGRIMVDWLQKGFNGD